MLNIIDQDQVQVEEVIIPLMNVSRRLPDGSVNPKEVNAQKLVMTSAGVKSSYAYSSLIDTFERSIIEPDAAFCAGMDYRVPMMHGLIDKKLVNSIKMSPSFNEASFATEYRRLLYSLNY